ncbi:carboxypeptidase-like regulatory domain-containing protein [Microbacter margulisiae]|uniref:TonB-dependent SusC/RagA subfamily outer membrane receptor n=1 Tax=Microbacter margulisiae TaxID=1350067 RepID=A0A7W5DPF9_9PORP|nr:carboxypeptidase-like regulatory domain-containing protein [Microbacter margulisiae]MBB3186541.1 TonB-dependent SusC/RagA subfamily outer membrane receptor [Microbacter margulisiae]
MRTKENNTKKRRWKSNVMWCFFVLLTFFPLFLNAQISINVKQQPLKDIIKLIETQSKYRFFYNVDLKGLDQLCTINIDNGSIEQTLSLLLPKLGIGYKMESSNLIALFLKQNVKEYTVPSSQKGTEKITGRVVDNKGEPLPGVTVIIQGTSKGTITDADGNYTLQNVSPGQTLEFSFIGMQNQEMKIVEKKSINITLSESATSLNEVLVIGYGTLNKKEISSSITHLSAKNLPTIGGNSALMSLQGQVAGLSVTNTATADPNATPSLQLMGVSSRNAGLGPLYVIDGVVGGDINNLNEDDIQSIDILKSGAASAIYGSQGSNGVILITTKHGEGAPHLTYNSYYTLNYVNDNISVLSKDDFLANKRGVDFGGSTNWMKAVTNSPAFSEKQTLQFSGGGNKTNY